MDKFKNSLITLAGLLVLISIVAAITPFKGYGKPSPEAVQAAQDVNVVNTAAAPALTRNVDAVSASDIVTLMITNTGFRRVTANGVLAASQFIVPDNQVLIITDVEWFRICGGCTGGGDRITLEVFGPTNTHRFVYSSVAMYSSNGQVGASESMETGFAVAAGGHVALGPGFSNGSNTLSVFLHGYLVAAN